VTTRADAEPLGFADRCVLALSEVIASAEDAGDHWRAEDVLHAAASWTTSERLGDWDDYSALRSTVFDYLAWKDERAGERQELPWE
jgi:enoyl-CoA hydratase/carnithine racemase